MLDYVQSMPADFSDSGETATDEVNAICISAVTLGDLSAPAIATMKL